MGMVREQACHGALTPKKKRSGGGAHQLGDLRLLEDGGERRGALGSDPVPSETASEERSENSGIASAPTGADRKGGRFERREAGALERYERGCRG